MSRIMMTIEEPRVTQLLFINGNEIHQRRAMRLAVRYHRSTCTGGYDVCGSFAGFHMDSARM